MNNRQLDELVKIVDDPNQEIEGMYKTHKGYELLLKVYSVAVGYAVYFDALITECGKLQTSPTQLKGPKDDEYEKATQRQAC